MIVMSCQKWECLPENWDCAPNFSSALLTVHADAPNACPQDTAYADVRANYTQNEPALVYATGVYNQHQSCGICMAQGLHLCL
jgi:hypothetical protein